MSKLVTPVRKDEDRERKPRSLIPRRSATALGERRGSNRDPRRPLCRPFFGGRSEVGWPVPRGRCSRVRAPRPCGVQ